jgi:hypothetical protein
MDTKQQYGNVRADDGANLRMLDTLLASVVLALVGILGYRAVYRGLGTAASRKN